MTMFFSFSAIFSAVTWLFEHRVTQIEPEFDSLSFHTEIKEKDAAEMSEIVLYFVDIL